jgi:O-methyltransferase
MHFFPLFRLPGMLAEPSKRIQLINKLLAKFGMGYQLKRIPDGITQMHTIEQRMNFHLLATRVLEDHVDGEWAEFGCFTGQSAMVFQKILIENASPRRIHLYDFFEKKYRSEKLSPKDELLKNFRDQALPTPQIHEGNFFDTVPAALPQKLGLVHIDCGYGGDTEKLKNTILHLLRHLYPRLSKGALVLLMDYHDPERTIHGTPINPGVRLACDEFLENKPESVFTLYGGAYSQGYFIKS